MRVKVQIFLRTRARTVTTNVLLAHFSHQNLATNTALLDEDYYYYQKRGIFAFVLMTFVTFETSTSMRSEIRIVVVTFTSQTLIAAA